LSQSVEQPLPQKKRKLHETIEETKESSGDLEDTIFLTSSAPDLSSKATEVFAEIVADKKTKEHLNRHSATANVE
jgi:hypothetical protein